MQDRFKFRFWFKDTQEMIYSEKFNDVQTLGQWLFGDRKYVVKMQCTGIKDKNCKLIYEGDIVQFYDDEFLQTMKIIWDNDELDFKAIGLKKSVECYEQDFSYLGYIKKEDSLEVIGNIYENK